MLDDALREERYTDLDPSRNPQAEDTYRRYCKWFDANDERIRFSHDSICSRFRHGGHEHENTESLVHELVNGSVVAGQIPPLVCIQYRGALRVIFGNRRLHAYRVAAGQARQEIWFRMIVHKYPELDSIRDRALRHAFRLKSIHAMTTDNDGISVNTRLHWSR